MMFDSMGKRLDEIEKFGQFNLEVARRALSEQVQFMSGGSTAEGMRVLAFAF
jgi:hypothetical protein